MRSTWGSITRLGTNRYRLRYWADLGDGRGRVRHSETVRGTRAEARRRLSEREAEHGTDHPSMTLEQVAERWWLPECRQRMADGSLSDVTMSYYMTGWRTYVLPRWGRVEVSGIRPLDVQEWLSGLTASTAQQARLVLRQVLRLAVLYELVPTNVADADYRMPKARAVEHPKTVWTARQCAEIAERLRGTALEPVVMLMAFGSCRVGEANGMRSRLCEPMEANGMTVMCCHVVGEMTNGGYRERTKNPQSRRWVVVPEPWSLRLAEIVSDGREWVTGDRPVPPNSLSRSWRREFADGGALSGLPRGELRALRNSWRTYMRDELRVDRDVLEKMMGHAGKGVGEVHYYRPDKDAFADEVSSAWNRYRSKVTWD